MESTPVAPETTQSQGETTVETQQPQTGPSEDSFFDPNQVSEELKPAYKQMQAAFTKKTQELAAQRKEFEAIKQKADQYAKYEQFIPVLEEMTSSQQVPKQTPELLALEQELKQRGYSEEAIEMSRITAQILLNQFQVRDQQASQEKQTTWINSQVDTASKLDARLTDSSLTYQTADGESFTFGSMVENLVAANPNWRKDPVAATKKAIAQADALIGRAKTDGKTELSDAASQKAKKFPNVNSSPQSAANGNKSLTFAEAAELSMKQLGLK